MQGYVPALHTSCATSGKTVEKLSELISRNDMDYTPQPVRALIFNELMSKFWGDLGLAIDAAVLYKKDPSIHLRTSDKYLTAIAIMLGANVLFANSHVYLGTTTNSLKTTSL
jgi:hypothetical protein